MFPEIMRPLSLVLFLVIVSSQAVVSGQTTRAELIEKQREDKAAKLAIYKPGRLEKILINAEDGKLRRLIAPHNGFFVGWGYTYRPTGAGFALGGGFRHDLFDRRARVVFEAGQSFRNYNMVRGDFSLPRLAHGALEVGVEGVYRHQPQDDYFGPGPDSLTENRVNYLYKDNEFNGRAIFTPRPWFNVGTRIGRIAPDIDSGTDSAIPSIEALFATQMSLGSVSPPTAPGRVEARYRLSPSNDSMGQPSACALLRADSSTAVPHSPNARALVTAGAATSATREAAISHAASQRDRAQRNLAICGPSMRPRPVPRRGPHT